jgi:hypothetical protein
VNITDHIIYWKNAYTKIQNSLTVKSPHDSDNWLQCYVCGTTVPIVHAKQDNEIVGIKEIPDSIHDSKKLVVEPFIKPRTRAGINRKSRLEPEELDSDIQQRLDSGAKLISYHDNSPDL